MKRLFLVVGTAVMVLPWLAGARAQADAIHWTASNNQFATIFSQTLGSNNYNAFIGLEPGFLAPGYTTSGTNSGSVVLTYLNAFDASGKLVGFGGSSGNYSLSLTLHDDASGASGTLTFRGNISGLINPSVGEDTISNKFLGPTTQTLKLGQNLYTVTIGPFVPPGVPVSPVGNGGTEGSISASITAQPAASATTPEPSSLVLACLGLPSLGLARWLRRRKGVDRNASND